MVVAQHGVAFLHCTLHAFLVCCLNQASALRSSGNSNAMPRQLQISSTCAPGTHWANSTSATFSCEACALGKYDDDSDATTKCRYCGAGRVAAGLSSTECTACPAGKSTSTDDYILSPGHGCPWCGGRPDVPLTNVALGKPTASSTEVGALFSGTFDINIAARVMFNKYRTMARVGAASLTMLSTAPIAGGPLAVRARTHGQKQARNGGR
jgi:hypothetical protein